MRLRRERLLLGAITLLAAGIRLLYATLPRLARWDEAGHLVIARNLADGLGYVARPGIPEMHLPPGLPFFSAGLLKLGFSPEWATSTIHIITGALLCVPVYLLARAIYNGRVGLLAAALVAAYPALAAQPFLWGTMTESPFLLCVFTGIWAVYRALGLDQKAGAGGQTGWYAAVGLCFGLAYLLRPEGLTYFAVLGLFMVLWHLARHSFWRVVTWGRLALAVLICLVVISPYVLFLHANSGQWMLSGKMGLILDIAPAYIAHDQVAHDLAVSRLDSTGQEIIWFSAERFQRSFSAYVLESPSRFFFYMRQNMAQTWDALFHQTLFSPWVVALAALGLFARPWDRRRWWHEGLLWAALLPLVSFWLLFVIDRFLIGVLPIGLIWAAAGLAHLVRWAAQTLQGLRPRPAGWLKTTAAALPIAVVLAFSLWLGIEQLYAGLGRMSWSHKDAGVWLRANSVPDDVIMARSTEVGLYAERQVIASPNATWPELLAYAHTRGARFLVIDEYEVTELRPQFGFLMHPEAAPPEVIYLRTFTNGGSTLVYRFTE